MAKAIIIGFGNPLRGDDGLGQRAAEELEEEFAGADVEVRSCHQLTPEIAEPVSRAEVAVFIDAAEDQPPGEFRCRRLEPSARTPTSFAHALDPEAVLAVAHALYGHCPDAALLSVGGERFEHGEGLSPAVQEAIPAVLDMARTIIEEHGG